MIDWLDPLRSALDARECPVPFFFRDDDAGWDDAGLETLLDVFEVHGTPIDVAAIPAAVGTRTAVLLRGRHDVTVHQHGYAHANHEPTGRRCEFGAARSPERQRRDARLGRDLLGAVLEEVAPVFTPPWNRCAPWTPALLRDLGFTVLSRDATAGTAGVAGLAEVPITVDWLAKRRGVPVDRAGRGRLLARSASGPGPVGVMLHHEVTPADDLTELGQLLALLAAHPAATVGHLHTLAAC